VRLAGVLLTVVSIGVLWASSASGDSSSAGKGSIDEAVARSSRVIDVKLTVECNEFGQPCARGSIQLYAGPRQAKVVRPAKIKCGEARRGVVTCTILRPAAARYINRCGKSFSNLVTEPVPRWEERVLRATRKGVERHPPVERRYKSPEVLPPGSHTLDLEVRLPYGLVQTCLYLVARSSADLPKENCLPEFSESVREELCAKETVHFEKELDQTIISVE
jgi:hypothetical protein